MSTTRNADQREVGRFNELASRWWDPQGEMRFLHRMNPVRVAWIASRATLPGAQVVDVGCGAGLLSEALAQAGARVLGIDLAADSLQIARLHQADSGATGLEYRLATAEELATQAAGGFDVVTCLEMLEHVPDPAATIAACATLARPGGHVFFSTINRNARAYAAAVIAAEYLLGVLPRGTHQYARFLRPAELDRAARGAGLRLAELAGLTLDLPTGGFRISGDVSVNYLAWYRRPTA